MDYPTYAVPEPAPPGARAHDPLAVALGNASLLGVGYLMLGRSKLAVAAGVVTVVLVSVLVSVARSWCEVVVLIWWAAVIARGWFLAGGRTRRVAVRRQRLVALGVTVPVLLAVGLLRFDASRIERSVTEARASGDCAQVPATPSPSPTGSATGSRATTHWTGPSAPSRGPRPRRSSDAVTTSWQPRTGRRH